MFLSIIATSDGDEHFVRTTSQGGHEYVVLEGFKTLIYLNQVALESKEYPFQLV
jgi:hypothetical protein